MKLLSKSLIGYLLLVSLPFGSFSPTHREDGLDGILDEMEPQTLDQDFLAPQEDENDARLVSDNVPENDQTSSDSTAADKTTSDEYRELSSENHPNIEKRQPFDFGGNSRSGKRDSSPREKQSEIDKREPFDFGGNSRTGKRTSSHQKVVSQDEPDEQFQGNLNKLLNRYKGKAVKVESRTALRTLEDVAMDLKREDDEGESLVDDDVESLYNSLSLDDDRNSFDDQVDETNAPSNKEDLRNSGLGTKRGNKVPVPGFLGSIKGFDSRLEPLENPVELEEE